MDLSLFQKGASKVCSLFNIFYSAFIKEPFFLACVNSVSLNGENTNQKCLNIENFQDFCNKAGIYLILIDIADSWDLQVFF